MATHECAGCGFILLDEEESATECPNCRRPWTPNGTGTSRSERPVVIPPEQILTASRPRPARLWTRLMLSFVLGSVVGSMSVMLWLGVGARVADRERIETKTSGPPIQSLAAAHPASANPALDVSEVRAIRDESAAKVYAAEQQRQRAEEELRSLAAIHQESLNMLRDVQAERDDLQDELEWMQADLAVQAATGNSTFIRRWQFLGPLSDAQGLEVRDRVERDPFRPDLEVTGIRGPTTWKPVDSPEDRIALSRLCEHSSQGVCYLTSWVYTPDARQVTLSLGSDDGFALWVNQARVIEKRGLRAASPGQDRVQVELQAGWNRLLANIDNSGGSDWAFLCEVRDAQNDAPLRLPASPMPPKSRSRDKTSRPAAGT